MKRLLITGYGDVAMRTLPSLARRYRVERLMTYRAVYPGYSARAILAPLVKVRMAVEQ